MWRSDLLPLCGKRHVRLEGVGGLETVILIIHVNEVKMSKGGGHVRECDSAHSKFGFWGVGIWVLGFSLSSVKSISPKNCRKCLPLLAMTATWHNGSGLERTWKAWGWALGEWSGWAKSTSAAPRRLVNGRMAEIVDPIWRRIFVVIRWRKRPEGQKGGGTVCIDRVGLRLKNR